jgi:ribonuclease Z
MEITFLGTSSGVPTKSRNVSGLALKKQDSKSWILIDCGEGTQHQLLHTKLSLKNLKTICITHVHGDHCYGLPGLLATTAMTGRTEPLTIIAPKGIEEFVTSTFKLTDTHLNYSIEFISVESLGLFDKDKEFKIEAIELSHRVPSFAYSFTEQKRSRRLDVDKLQSLGIERGPLWGQLQSGQSITLDNGQEIQAADSYLPLEKARKIIIGGDNDTPDLLAQAAKEADLLVHESTYTSAVSEKVGSGPQHSCSKRVAQFAEHSRVKNLILTHFSARYQPDSDKTDSIDEVENEAKQYFKGNLWLANDLDRYHLDKNRLVTKQINE